MSVIRPRGSDSSDLMSLNVHEGEVSSGKAGLGLLTVTVIQRNIEAAEISPAP